MNNQLLAAFGAVLAVALPVIRSYIQTKFTPQKLAHLTSYASVAVRAAEKLGELTPAGTDPGSAKLNYACDVVVAGAKKLGVKLSQDEVLAFVHAALRDMEQYERLNVPMAPQF